MPRVRASMAEVSTDFSPVEPGVHVYEVVDCIEHEDEDTSRISYEVRNKVLQVLDGGREEDIGRSVIERIHIHKRDGDLNEMGLAELKRYFEVTVGEDKANDEEADTDWLKGQQYKGQTMIETYKVTDALSGEEEVRKRNKISKKAPL